VAHGLSKASTSEKPITLPPINPQTLLTPNRNTRLTPKFLDKSIHTPRDTHDNLQKLTPPYSVIGDSSTFQAATMPRSSVFRRFSVTGDTVIKRQLPVCLKWVPDIRRGVRDAFRGDRAEARDIESRSTAADIEDSTAATLEAPDTLETPNSMSINPWFTKTVLEEVRLMHAGYPDSKDTSNRP
jgi:hypothetical protein